jgi:hypothetical protein
MEYDCIRCRKEVCDYERLQSCRDDKYNKLRQEAWRNRKDLCGSRRLSPLNEKSLSLSYLTLVWPMLLFQFDHIFSLQIPSSIISSLVQSKCITSIPVFSVFLPKTSKELCSYTFNQTSNRIVIIISISYFIRDLHVKILLAN